MSEPTPASIRYEQPAIVRRDSIAGLLENAISDGKPVPDGTNTSDVNVKENIRPVRW
jgi:hypothetical protein